MSETHKNHLAKKTGGALLILLLLMSCLPVNAQFLRTSYFMEGTHYRQKLNPSFLPDRGYIAIPFIGQINASVNSNSLDAGYIMDIIDNGDDFYNDKDFLKGLSNQNRLNVNSNTDLFSFGWYKGANFWSVNVGTSVDIGAEIPKSMFSFLRDIDKDDFNWNNSKFDIGKEQLNINAYTEIGVGFARAINKRLTVGGKVKLLLGMGDLNLNVDNISIDANLPKYVSDITDINQIRNYHAKLKVNARLESSFKGMDLQENTNDPNPQNHYIDDFDFNSFGIAGYGGAIDLGASYKILDKLTVSASVLDLGFIKWSKGSTNIATASQDLNYDGKDYTDNIQGLTEFKQDAEDFLSRVEGGDVLDYDMLRLQKEDVKKSRTSTLHSTVMVGAEYKLIDKWLSFGALSTTRFTNPKAQTELTLSANMHPKSWLNASLSYSMIQSAGKSFGLAVRVGPLFVGTDYMYLGNSSKCISGFLGISVPLGKKRPCECK